MILPALQHLAAALTEDGGRIVTVDGSFDIEGTVVLDAFQEIAHVPLGERWRLLDMAAHATVFVTPPTQQLQANGRFRLVWLCDGSAPLTSPDTDPGIDFDPGSVITVRTTIPAALGRHAGDMMFQFVATPA